MAAISLGRPGDPSIQMIEKFVDRVAAQSGLRLLDLRPRRTSRDKARSV